MHCIDAEREGGVEMGVFSKSVTLRICRRRVLARAVERLDAQILLDPPKEQFDVPARVVELRNRDPGTVTLLVRNVSRFVVSGST